MSAMLIPIAGAFQVFDGTQVVCVGILRGLGDVHAAMWTNVVGFWLIGLPIGVVCAFTLGAGPQGLWWGAAAGLAAVAMLLLARVRSQFRGAITRVRLDTA
jgi:MATE family multidrug resistance protein